ncbi:MAG: type II toxin-antitoxin system VapB family antitoxin [Desulfohalobiaceae bacterium]
MRTNIVIRDDLMQKAMELAQNTTKKKVVEEALETFIQKKQQERIRTLRGKLKWEGDLDSMRLDK